MSVCRQKSIVSIGLEDFVMSGLRAASLLDIVSDIVVWGLDGLSEVFRCEQRPM